MSMMISIARVSTTENPMESAVYEAEHKAVFGDSMTIKAILRDPNDAYQVAVVGDVKDHADRAGTEGTRLTDEIGGEAADCFRIAKGGIFDFRSFRPFRVGALVKKCRDVFSIVADVQLQIQ